DRRLGVQFGQDPRAAAQQLRPHPCQPERLKQDERPEVPDEGTLLARRRPSSRGRWLVEAGRGVLRVAHFPMAESPDGATERYQSTVRRSPSSRGTLAFQPSRVWIFVTSGTRRTTSTGRGSRRTTYRAPCPHSSSIM